MLNNLVKNISRAEIVQRKTKISAIAATTGNIYYGKDASDGTTNTTTINQAPVTLHIHGNNYFFASPEQAFHAGKLKVLFDAKIIDSKQLKTLLTDLGSIARLDHHGYFCPFNSMNKFEGSYPNIFGQENLRSKLERAATILSFTGKGWSDANCEISQKWMDYVRLETAKQNKDVALSMIALAELNQEGKVTHCEWEGTNRGGIWGVTGNEHDTMDHTKTFIKIRSRHNSQNRLGGSNLFAGEQLLLIGIGQNSVTVDESKAQQPGNGRSKNLRQVGVAKHNMNFNARVVDANSVERVASSKKKFATATNPIRSRIYDAPATVPSSASHYSFHSKAASLQYNANICCNLNGGIHQVGRETIKCLISSRDGSLEIYSNGKPTVYIKPDGSIHEGRTKITSPTTVRGPGSWATWVIENFFNSIAPSHAASCESARMIKTQPVDFLQKAKNLQQNNKLFVGGPMRLNNEIVTCSTSSRDNSLEIYSYGKPTIYIKPDGRIYEKQELITSPTIERGPGSWATWVINKLFNTFCNYNSMQTGMLTSFAGHQAATSPTAGYYPSAPRCRP